MTRKALGPERGMALAARSGRCWGMQVPPDLATRLAQLAHIRGRSPEVFLREALCQWMEGMAPAAQGSQSVEAAPGRRQFVPQPPAFSVYE